MKKKVLSIILALSIMTVVLMGCGGAGPEGISQDEYDNIYNGMSQYEAFEVIGGTGDKISESTTDEATITVYKFEGEKGGSAKITFEYKYDEGGLAKVTGKEKDGLK